MSLSTETLFHFFVATMSYGKFIVSSLHNNPWNCSDTNLWKESQQRHLKCHHLYFSLVSFLFNSCLLLFLSKRAPSL